MVSPDADDENANGHHLPKSFVQTVFGKVQNYVPAVFKEDVRLKERELRAAERRLQRRFIAQYKAQVSLLEPVLHERGVAVGTAIRDALLGDHNVDATYQEVIYRTPGLQLVDSKVSTQTRETLKLLDPLIEPVLTSFVNGVEQPLNESLNDFKTVRFALRVASPISLAFSLGIFAHSLPIEAGDGVGRHRGGVLCHGYCCWAGNVAQVKCDV
jgi:hypothetical protein